MDLLDNSVSLIILCVTVITLNVLKIKRDAKLKINIFFTTIGVTFLTFLCPLVLLLFPVLWLLHQIIHGILKLKYGDKLVGLVKNMDVYHFIGKPEHSLINVLIVLKFDHNKSSEDVFDVIKKLIENLIIRNPVKLSKFHSICTSSMGFYYLLRTKITTDDCLKKMKKVDLKQKEMSKNTLNQLLSEYYYKPLPECGILWDFHLGTQPLDWGKEPEEGVKYYPILFRISHGLADGVAIIKLLTGVFVDKCVIIDNKSTKKSNSYDKNQKLNKIHILNICQKILNQFLLICQILCYTPASFYMTLMLKGKDDNILCNSTPLSRQERLAFNLEPTGKYFKKIKDIKKKIPGTSFPEVLITAFSASLRDHFEKYSSTRPETVTVIVPIVPGSSELKDLNTGHLDAAEINFKNDYMVILLQFPMFVKEESGKDSLINRLKLIKNEINNIKNSVDIQTNYFLMTILWGVLPHPLVKFFLTITESTGTLSILPGSRKLSVDNGKFEVMDIIFWVPHVTGLSVSLSVYTYDQRLQLGINADKASISDQHACQQILDNVHKYLDILEEEADSLNK